MQIYLQNKNISQTYKKKKSKTKVCVFQKIKTDQTHRKLLTLLIPLHPTKGTI